MSDGIVAEVADRLWQAEIDGSPIGPITDAHPDLVLQDAYAIQTYNIERRVASGRVIRGRKVGLTSRPMQELLGVSEPDFGVLLDDMFVEYGDEVPLETMLQPRVEAEMTFVIGADLTGPGVTTSNALTAIAGVLPAIEIVDSRIADWKIRLIDTVADNASSGKLVIGGKLTKVTDLDLRLAGMVMTRNGAVIDTGAGAAPGSTMSSACSEAPKVASLLASQVTQRAGLPSAARASESARYGSSCGTDGCISASRSSSRISGDRADVAATGGEDNRRMPSASRIAFREAPNACARLASPGTRPSGKAPCSI